MHYLLYGQETERMVFRAHYPEDFELWLPFFSDPDAVRFVGLGSYPSPESACEAWFEKVETRLRDLTGGMNVLTEKVSGVYLGQCGLLTQAVDGEEILEIGYSLLPSARGRGFATEAAIKCRDLAFENRYAERLHSIIHRENMASARVAEKNGMRIIQTTEFMGMPVNIYAIDRDTWEELKREA